MAGSEDAVVKAKIGEILLSIEASNFTIHLDIVEAACKLPADLAGSIADKETAWLESATFLDTLIPDRFADLVIYLSTSGDPRRALEINRVTLGFLDEPVEDSEAERFFRRPRTKLDRWHFGQFIGKTWEALAKADWEAALEQYSDLLNEYLNRRYPDSTGTGDSFSSSWLKGVEHDEEEIELRLVATVRRISELAVSQDISLLPRVLEMLVRYEWDVFKRIIFHVLRYRASEIDIDVITQYLLVSDSFRDRNLFHEYSLLLSVVFVRLSPDKQSTILHWVDSFVPTIETVQDRAKRWNGADISREDAEWEIRRGKLRWLEAVKENLPEEWLTKYNEWTQHFGGAPRMLEGVQAMWVGEPPVPELLRNVSSNPDEILQYLASPRAAEESPHGLARELRYLVERNSDGFIDSHERIRELEPRYVCAFLLGVHSSTTPISIDKWPQLLSFLRWVMEQPALEFPLGVQQNEYDNSWPQSRSVIGDIISSQLTGEEVRIPFDLRFELWPIIEALTDDPNPTPAYEARYGGSNMDPLTLSLNTIRGEAFHTLFKYLYWCRRSLGITERTLQSTSEVLPVLERHLDPAIDPSAAVRSVYGEQLPALIALDPDWVRGHLPQIFPPDGALAAFYKNAWETFIVWTRPYDNVFEMLQEQYSYGIDHLQDESLYRSESAASRLTEHLVAFYARSLIEFEPETLLHRFYETASGSQAAHVFWFIARILRENNVAPDIVQRFIRLIEERLANGTGEERTAFGWLFTSGKLDPGRSLELLRDAVAVTRDSDPDHSVIERVAELASQFPELAIESTIFLVDGADSEWKLQYWAPHLRTIIETALNAGFNGQADLLVNKLVAKNLPDFRNLLSGGEK